MAFLKAHGFFILIGVVAVAALGGGGWAYVKAEDVEKTMRDLDGLVAKVRQLRSNPANQRTIEAKRKEGEEHQARFETSINEALSMQRNNAFFERADGSGDITSPPRALFVPEVLPKAKSALRLAFKESYDRAFKELHEKLRARGAPTEEEIQKHENQLSQLKQPAKRKDAVYQPWGQPSADSDGDSAPDARERSLTELLRASPMARAADEVARSVYMYVDKEALGRNPLRRFQGAPSQTRIWQAQMSLWIHQDIATALARCNEERAEELRQRGVAEPFWVGQMPVKHVQRVSIADVLGKGGGTGSKNFSRSFTKIKNNNKRFVVPLKLELVVEEAALVQVMEKLCGTGFYTPIAVKYQAVRPNPCLLDRNNLFIYGDDPVLRVTLELEGYYFREVFEPWIPEDLKKIIEKPGAKEGGRSGRG